MKRKNKYNPNGTSWKDLQAALYSPEEIENSRLRVAVAGELIKAREEKKISSEDIDSVDESTTQLDVLMNILRPLGKTLQIVSLKGKEAI